MSLLDVRPGCRVVIRSLAGGRAMVGRLCGMGLCPGTEAFVVTGRRGGPVIVDVRGSRVAIGCGMAGRIVVDVLPGPAAAQS
jgi:Fe2+ transport system protein FeoA